MNTRHKYEPEANKATHVLQEAAYELGAMKEVDEDLKKVLLYMKKYRISLSKDGKERLIQRFPQLKDEIINMERFPEQPLANKPAKE